MDVEEFTEAIDTLLKKFRTEFVLLYTRAIYSAQLEVFEAFDKSAGDYHTWRQEQARVLKEGKK